MIVTVKTESELDRFVNLPRLIYHGDRNWVKPLIGTSSGEFRPSANPALKYHELELYLSVKNNTLQGRIAAFVDQRYNAMHSESTAFFGFFECLHKLSAAKELFSAVEHFAKITKMKNIIGPVDFSTNYQAGLLIDGYTRPSVMTPYNKKYYPRLVESNRYKKLVDLFAYQFTREMSLPDRLHRVAKIVSKRHPEVSVRPLNLTTRFNRTNLLTSLYNESFSDNWGYVPMTPREFAYLLKTLTALEHTALNYIAYAGSKPVGLLLTVPDLYSAARSPTVTGQAANPEGFRELRVTVLGIVPAYRKRGIEAKMGLRLWTDALDAGYDKLEFSVILENNAPMNNFVSREFGLPVSKTFRIYEKPVEY